MHELIKSQTVNTRSFNRETYSKYIKHKTLWTKDYILLLEKWKSTLFTKCYPSDSLSAKIFYISPQILYRYNFKVFGRLFWWIKILLVCDFHEWARGNQICQNMDSTRLFRFVIQVGFQQSLIHKSCHIKKDNGTNPHLKLVVVMVYYCLCYTPTISVLTKCTFWTDDTKQTLRLCLLNTREVNCELWI